MANASIRAFSGFIGPLTLGKCLLCLRSQIFSGCKTSRSSGVNNWKPVFSLARLPEPTANASEFGKTHCFPEFTARLTYGKHSVFSRSQKFSPVFLYFPRQRINQEYSRFLAFTVSRFQKFSCTFLAFSLTSNPYEFKKTPVFHCSRWTFGKYRVFLCLQ